MKLAFSVSHLQPHCTLESALTGRGSGSLAEENSSVAGVTQASCLQELLSITRTSAQYKTVNVCEMCLSYRSISKLSNSCGLQNERYVVRKVRTKLGSEKAEQRIDFMFNLPL